MFGRSLLPRLLFLALSITSQVDSAPVSPLEDASVAAGPVVLSTSEVESFKPYAYLAGAGYCPLSTWSCGVFCQGVPNFELKARGGDGAGKAFWYVGYAPTLGEIIVGHQGTNSSNAMSILNNLNFIRKSLPQADFPGVPSGASVHSGFLTTALNSASSVLTAVNSLVQSTGSKKVVIVGHSLGGATANLQGIYLKLRLATDISVKVVGFASPRVGNAAFAALTDATISNLSHINNKKDPVPILPGRFLGYTHPSGEVHISNNGAWYSCPGQDSTLADCTIAAVPNLLVSNVNDHGGPYAGVSISSQLCT